MGYSRDRDGILLGLVWPAVDTAKKLAAVMSDVQAMSIPGLRQQVLKWVKDRNRAFDPPRSNRDLEEINNFILACGADDESFDLLLEAIEVYTPGDDPNLARLESLVNTLLPRAALTKGELRELLALEPDKIPKGDQLVNGIRLAGGEPTGREGRDINPGNVQEAALLLLDTPSAENGLCRLLRFVDWLAEAAVVMCDSSESSKAGQLRNWTDRVANAHGVSAPTWRTPVGPVPGGEPALLIELEQTIGDRFTVYLWLWVPGSGAHTLEWDENPCRLDELRERLDELLELASRRLAGTKGVLRVEFLLDIETFHQDVDWWLFGADEGLARPLGAEYAVMVRRQRSTAQEQRRWQARWQALKQSAMPVGELAVWVRDATTLSLKDLWAQLTNDQTRVFVAPLGTCDKVDDEMKTLFYLALSLLFNLPGCGFSSWVRFA